MLLYSLRQARSAFTGKGSKVEATRQVNLVAPNFGSWVGTCTGIVGLYKHLFHVKAHS